MVVPGLAMYSSSKAGLTQFSACLRAELRGTQIGSTLVELGPVRTEMLDRVTEYRPVRQAFSRMRKLRLLARADSQDVAAAVAEAIAHDRRHVRLPAARHLLPRWRRRLAGLQRCFSPDCERIPAEARDHSRPVWRAKEHRTYLSDVYPFVMRDASSQVMMRPLPGSDSRIL